MNNRSLQVPSRYSRCGIKVKCLKCKRQIGSICGLTKASIRSCDHKEKHKYNLVVCVPGSTGVRRTRIIHTQDFNEALIEMAKFRKELKENRYLPQAQMEVSNTKLEYFITSYLDSMSGVNTPSHLIRNRSRSYILECTHVLKQFKKALKKKGYVFELLDAKDITDTEVGIFHDYILTELKLSQRTYNKYMGVLKTLYYWIQRVKDYPVNNVFRHVVLHTVKKDVEIISKEEFDRLLNAVSRKHSYDPKCNRYLYREWLKSAYKLAAETGLRREELLTLRWSNIQEIGEDKKVIRVGNLKVNRILTGRDAGKHHKFIPVTKSLESFLNSIGYDEKKHTDLLIIERPSEQSLKQAMDILTRSFSHYMRVAGNRSLNFGVLRKTYMTKLTIAAGPNAKLFTGSSSEEVLKNHYLSQAFMTAKLDDFTIFD